MYLRSSQRITPFVGEDRFAKLPGYTGKGLLSKLVPNFYDEVIYKVEPEFNYIEEIKNLTELDVSNIKLPLFARRMFIDRFFHNDIKRKFILEFFHKYLIDEQFRDENKDNCLIMFCNDRYMIATPDERIQYGRGTGKIVISLTHVIEINSFVSHSELLEN